MPAKEKSGPKGAKGSERSDNMDLHSNLAQRKARETRTLLNRATLSVWAATLILSGLLVFGIHEFRERIRGIEVALEEFAQDNKLLLEGMDELLVRMDQPVPEPQEAQPPQPARSPAAPPSLEPPEQSPDDKAEKEGKGQKDGSDGLARRYKIYYRVKDGEDLAQVSERFKVSEDELRLWNSLQETETVIPGQVLVINKVTEPDKPVAVAGSSTGPTPAKGEQTAPAEPPPSRSVPDLPGRTGAKQEEEAAAGERSAGDSGPENEAAEEPAPGEQESATVIGEPPAGEAVEPTVHIVKEGESLSGIGKKYGVPWERLAAENRIKPPGTIHVGQRLKIPASPGKSEGASSPTGGILHEVQEGENLFRIGQAYGMSWERIAEANGIADPAGLYVGQVLKIPGGKEGPEP